MMVLDLRPGQTALIGNQPVICLWASGGKARLATPSVIEESVEDLRRFFERSQRGRKGQKNLDTPPGKAPNGG